MREWMKSARKQAGMTMEAAAFELGMTEGYYSLIEGGKRKKKLDIPLAAKMAAVFGIPMETIIARENQPPDAQPLDK